MLEIIVVTILISTVLNVFFKKFDIPTIIWYIVSWAIITQIFDLQSMVNSDQLNTIAEFGIVFLMFTIWLELSVKQLVKMKKNVFLNGSLQFFVTTTILSVISIYLLNIEVKQAIIISAGLSLSSTAIILKLLNESGDIKKEYWNLSLWILLFQDIIVIAILLLITIFSNQSTNISLLLIQTILSAIFLIIIFLLAWKYLLEPFLYRVSKTNSNEIFISSILLLIMWASFLAHNFGFSYSLWAIIIGIMIAETHYKHQVESDLIPFRDLLLWIFFVVIWMKIDFSIVSENIKLIWLLVAWLFIIKTLIIFVILCFSTKKRVALKTALSLFQLWEFWLVIFQIASISWLIELQISQILTSTIIISMIITPFIFKNIDNIVSIFSKIKDNNTDYKVDSISLNDHIILIGYGRLGTKIADLIDKEWLKYIIVESDIKRVKEALELWRPIIFWSSTKENILELVNIKQASSIIVSIWNNKKLQLVCEMIDSMGASSKAVIKVNKFEEKDTISDLNLWHIIVETEKTALAMFEESLKRE